MVRGMRGVFVQFGHAGSNEGFSSLMRFYPNSGQGAVIMVNSNEGWPLISEILQAISTEYKWPDSVTDDKIIVELENINDYVGIYSSTDGTELKITVNDNQLSLNYGQQPPILIFPSSTIEFFSTVVNAVVNFEKDDKSIIIALTINQSGETIKASKQA